MGDCVNLCGVLLVGVSSRGVVWLMCVSHQTTAFSTPLPGKVVAAETVDKFKFERYREVLDRDVGRTFR